MTECRRLGRPHHLTPGARDVSLTPPLEVEIWCPSSVGVAEPTLLTNTHACLEVPSRETRAGEGVSVGVYDQQHQQQQQQQQQQ